MHVSGLAVVITKLLQEVNVFDGLPLVVFFLLIFFYFFICHCCCQSWTKPLKIKPECHLFENSFRWPLLLFCALRTFSKWIFPGPFTVPEPSLCVCLWVCASVCAPTYAGLFVDSESLYGVFTHPHPPPGCLCLASGKRCVCDQMPQLNKNQKQPHCFPSLSPFFSFRFVSLQEPNKTTGVC